MSISAYFGPFGGQFVPETLKKPLDELEGAFNEVQQDPSFQKELSEYLRTYAGRPTPLYKAQHLLPESRVDLYLKREDLLHGGAHKTNNCLGQGLLAQRMGKTRLIAETGAGQHGVATAMVGALLGIKTVIYMGSVDMKRQEMNVFRMRLMGANVIPVSYGSGTLKDAINEALRDWIANVRDTFYVFGTVAGPHPYPQIVRSFQKIIGEEAQEQLLKLGKDLPDYVVAAVGGGSNAIGIFAPFINNSKVSLIGVEAAGEGITTRRHASTLTQGRIGILHGAKSFLLQSDEGQILQTHSISAGLDYPGVGPEHSYLKEHQLATYVSVTDREAVDAFQLLCKREGIIPALESAHAIAYALQLAEQHKNVPKKILVNLSGRGDKDLHSVMDYLS
jgi:tryptophan synthase beta chain